MSVSESLDWRHASLSSLDGHRFIGRTRGGQVVDGWLRFVRSVSSEDTCVDGDELTVVLHGRPGGVNRPGSTYRELNVLSDTRRSGRLLGGHDDDQGKE